MGTDVREVNTIQHGRISVRRYLESKGLVILNFPHFAQNFQRRSIFVLESHEEKEYFKNKPLHMAYAPAAQKMRIMLIEAMGKFGLCEQSSADTEAYNVASPEQAPTARIAIKKVERMSTTESELFSNLFHLLQQSGDKLYPIKMKNRDTGKIAFRVSAVD